MTLPGGDYVHDHPRSHVPDLRSDNRLSLEAHLLLDDPNTWRESMRKVSTFQKGLSNAQLNMLDADGNDKLTEAEMLAFVNDAKQDPLARHAVELLRENPSLVGKDVGIDALAYEVQVGTIEGVEMPGYKKQAFDQINKETATFMAGGLALGTVVGVGASVFGTPVAGAFFGGLIAAPTLLIGGESSLINYFDTNKMVNDARGYKSKLDKLDLFDSQKAAIISWNDFSSQRLPAPRRLHSSSGNHGPGYSLVTRRLEAYRPFGY